MSLVDALKSEIRKLYEIPDVPWQRLMKFFVAAAAFFGLAVVFVSPWKVLAFFLGIGLLVAVYARPLWMLAVLAVFIPLEPFALKFVPDELFIYAKYFSEILIYLLLGSALLRRVLAGERRAPTPLDLPFALLVLVAIASAVSNFVDPGIAVLGTRQIIRFMLLFFAVAMLAPPRAYLRQLVVLMLGLVLFESLLGMLQAVTLGAIDPLLLPSESRFYSSLALTGGTEQFWAPGQRVFATLGRYDQLGTFLCFFLLLLSGWVYEIQKGRWHRYFFLLFAIGSFALMLTYSRASWFGFLLGFLYIAVRIKKDKKVLAAFLATVALIVGYTFYTGVVVRALTDLPEQTVLARLLEAFSYERWRGEYYGYGRVYWMLNTPLKVVPASPLFGHGPGSYGGGAAAVLGNTGVYDKLGLPFGVYGTEGYIDNNWFSLWGEIGTLGLALYIWMFALLFRASHAVYRGTKDPLVRGLALGYLGATLAFAFQAFLGTYLEVRTISLYFWMFGAFIVALGQREKIL
ncbi:MAG: hypothetical protein QY323_02665 [Patescibacteria group bacterium]|nr:MAG: hypothetical protein QY323_02665 [Patescibacteria group bacterium]